MNKNYVKFITEAKDLCVFFDWSYKNLQYFDIFRNSYNGSLNVKLPSGFSGQVVVYNSMGQSILTSNDSEINQDLSSLKNIPPGIYRAIFQTGSKRFTKTFIN